MVLRAACFFLSQNHFSTAGRGSKLHKTGILTLIYKIIIANCLSLSTDFRRLYAEINLSQFAECGLQTKMRLKTVANELVALSAVHRCFKTSRAHLGLGLQVSLITS